jgi:hypothetical protein
MARTCRLLSYVRPSATSDGRGLALPQSFVYPTSYALYRSSPITIYFDPPLPAAIVTRHLFCVVQNCLLNRPSLLLDALAGLLFSLAQLDRVDAFWASGAISVRCLKCRSASAIPLVVSSNLCHSFISTLSFISTIISNPICLAVYSRRGSPLNWTRTADST